ncbi:MAG: hypothetical protein WBH10_03665 [Allopontixanthobacter sediminis]
MMNHSRTENFFDNIGMPAENLICEESKGLRDNLSGKHLERLLIAGECIGPAN